VSPSLGWARRAPGRVRVLLLLLAWLPVARIAEARAATSAELYGRECAVCHGSDGRGDGPAAGLLSPRPRDFTSGLYKFRSTPSGTLPTVDDLVGTITAGLPGTSMPGYLGLLSAGEIASLARHILTLAPPGSSQDRPLELGEPGDSGSKSVEQGRVLFESVGCAGCHGRDGRGAGWRPAREGLGADPRPTDLSTPWTFRGGSAAESIARRILTGIDGSPMGSYADRLTTAEAWALALYVPTLARRPAWEETDPVRIRTAGVAVDPLERGRYLVNAMLCPLCHTPISPDTGTYDTASFLAGGMRVSAYPWGVWYSRNLTPDPETGLGHWSEEAIINAVTRGIARGGRRLDPMAMPWPWFARLTPSDARAVAAYLRSIPAVRNPVPPRESVLIIERAGGKLLALLGAETSVDFWGGNAGAEARLRGGVPAPDGRRGWAWALGSTTLALGGLLLVAGWRRRSRRRVWLAVGAAVLAGWLTLAAWPPLAVMPPELVTRWLFMGSPSLPGSLDDGRRALAGRGEYVATIAPCGLCHTPAGVFLGFYTDRTLAGGMEGRWRVYGSAHSTNLTPDPTSGIDGLDDATIQRALRSGIGRDGRRMHWQAMPWDITSHWSEEDQRALIAYLRALPPVRGVVPRPRGPAPGDPPADAFFFGDSARR
jgi:mono/diheme cytochrome c family protein